LRYAEIRALVGGITAIQGASGRIRSTEEALVRNVDLRIFGQHRARAMIDLPSPSSRDAEKLRDIVAEIGRGEVDAFYLHLAEGQADNLRSRNEFGRLVEDYQGLTPATVLIHGTALSRQQLGQVKDAGASWSGRRRATCGCTARPPSPPTRCSWGSRSGWARTGCPAAAPACSQS
jgi:5-methylthioadenosine/S-adenosylhomocysteine deaminase